MEGEGLESYIFDEPPHTHFDDDKQNDSYVWENDDSLIKSWIRGTEEVLYIVSKLWSANQMWKAFEEAFA